MVSIDAYVPKVPMPRLKVYVDIGRAHRRNDASTGTNLIRRGGTHGYLLGMDN